MIAIGVPLPASSPVAHSRVFACDQCTSFCGHPPENSIRRILSAACGHMWPKQLGTQPNTNLNVLEQFETIVEFFPTQSCGSRAWILWVTPPVSCYCETAAHDLNSKTISRFLVFNTLETLRKWLLQWIVRISNKKNMFIHVDCRLCVCVCSQCWGLTWGPSHTPSIGDHRCTLSLLL